MIVEGTAEPYNRVTVRADGGLEKTTTANANSTWSLTLSGLADGVYVLQAWAAGLAGNESSLSPAVEVTVDTQPPQVSGWTNPQFVHIFRLAATDTGKLRTSTLPAEEFTRRFLQHVLPRGFVKVRYYGFLAHGCRKRLAALHQQLGHLSPVSSSTPGSGDKVASSDVATPNHVPLCPSCGRPMRRRSTIRPGDIMPRERCPP